MFIVGFCFAGNNVFASDNVLQVIQIDGFKDSYNIILKSDDVAELKKTIQAPNKMLLNLKGIRASKTINTIYNNTSSVDSVVVEPTGEDSIKILIQANNVSNAEVNFDTLKTPLNVLNNSKNQSKENNEIILNEPVESYQPIYQSSMDEMNSSVSLLSTSEPIIKYVKKTLKSEKVSWLITCVLFSVLLLNGIKLIKRKDSEIKIGLSQSLKEREIDLYKDLNTELNGLRNPALREAPPVQTHSGQNIAGNYGLRTYQQGTRNPYFTPEIQHAKPPADNLRKIAQHINSNLKQAAPGLAQSPAQKTAPTDTKTKTTNIDGMKFLESMTKIYEKNGRTDLAQGLKTNMKKAKVNPR